MVTFDYFVETMPLVSVLRGIQPNEALDIAGALIQAGFLCVEVTLNSPQPFESIKKMADTFGDQAIIGAGTVLSVDHVNQVADAGGRIIVMPHTDVAVIRAAKKRGLYCLPGVCTPSDAFAAIDAGADGLKLFPAELAQPPVLKAMRAVLPKTLPVLPTGSINAENMAGYLRVGANGFGLGSVVYKPGDTAETVMQKAQDMILSFKESK